MKYVIKGYPLDINKQEQAIDTPTGSKILSCRLLNGYLYLYLSINLSIDSRLAHKRKIGIYLPEYGINQDIKDYIGSFILPNADLFDEDKIYHVFELK